jgi:hypothetical protein
LQVSALGGLPKAIGEVQYLDEHAINGECDFFKHVLEENPGAFAEPFLSAPSPGIVAMAVRNEHYDTLASYLSALGEALKVEYQAIVAHGLLLQIDAPDLALERHVTYKNQALSAFVEFVELVVATINQALAMRTNFAALPNIRWTTIRFSLPASSTVSQISSNIRKWCLIASNVLLRSWATQLVYSLVLIAVSIPPRAVVVSPRMSFGQNSEAYVRVLALLRKDYLHRMPAEHPNDGSQKLALSKNPLSD